MLQFSKEAQSLIDLGFTYEQSYAVIRGLHQAYFKGLETTNRLIDCFQKDALSDSILAIDMYLKD